MQRIALIFFLVGSDVLHSGPPPEKPPLQHPVVTPHVPREAPSVRHNPGHK